MPEVEKDPPDDGGNNNEDNEVTEPLSQFNGQLNHLRLRGDPARQLHGQESGEASLEARSPALSTQSWTASYRGFPSTDCIVTNVTVFAPLQCDQNFSSENGASVLPTHPGTGSRRRSRRSLSLDSNDLQGFEFLKQLKADLEVDHAVSDSAYSNGTDRMALTEARRIYPSTAGEVPQQYKAVRPDASGTEHLRELDRMQASDSLFHGHLKPGFLPPAAASAAKAGADETVRSVVQTSAVQRSTGAGSALQSRPAGFASESLVQQSSSASLLNAGQPPPAFAAQNSGGRRAQASPEEEDAFDDNNAAFQWPRPTPKRLGCQYFQRSVSCSF